MPTNLVTSGKRSKGATCNLDAPSEVSISSDEGTTEPESRSMLRRAINSVNNNSERNRAKALWQAFTKRWRTVIPCIPIAILTIFGIIHLVLVIAGGSRFYWTLNNDFLPPDWEILENHGAGLASNRTYITQNVLPVPVHSHNDFWRSIPLFEALHWGCTSVEADVWHFDGDDELYVGHNTRTLKKDRTFRSLYIDPLVALLDGMNMPNDLSTDLDNIESWQGVFHKSPIQTLVLLVDLKTDGPSTLASVSSQLEPLRTNDYLSYWNGSTFYTRAVTVLSSGNTPYDDIIAAGDYRDIFIDAPLADLTSKSFNSSNSYYASVSLNKIIGHVWNGRLSSTQTDIIRSQIAEAHKRGLQARYWDTPNWPVNLRNYIWDQLISEGADVLNADDVKAAAALNWKRRIHGLWY